MSKDSDQIELIASGYDWMCPRCQVFHHISCLQESVQCLRTNKVYEVVEAVHAFDN